MTKSPTGVEPMTFWPDEPLDLSSVQKLVKSSFVYYIREPVKIKANFALDGNVFSVRYSILS